MPSAQPPPLVFVRALESNAHSVKAGTTKRGKRLGTPCGGVALQRDLRCGGKVILRANGIQKQDQPICSQNRRGSAAKIDGIDFTVFAKRRLFFKVTPQTLDVPFHPSFVGMRNRAKVAIQAFASAKRNMQIESELPHQRLPS